jgi:hypothetical protein
MIQLPHNMAENFVPKDASTSLLEPGNCLELERLANTRKEAFTNYLSARHHLSLRSESEAAGHNAAFETFEAARRKLQVSQRDWEQHVAAHHMG